MVADDVFCNSADALVALVAESAVPAVATFKFATRVVEVTVNGAVPVAIVEINCPVTLAFAAVTLPVTARLVNVPTLVILGCAAVVTVPAVVAVPAKPAVAAFRLATWVVEDTTRGAVPVATVEINCPVTLAFPAVTLPVTANDVSVPTEVMLGCAFVVTVPAVVALVAAPDRAPTNVVAVIELLDKLAVKPVLVSSAAFPVAAFAKTRKLFPVPVATLIVSVTPA